MGVGKKREVENCWGLKEEDVSVYCKDDFVDK